MTWPTGPMWAPPARRSEHIGYTARVEDDRLVVYSVTRGDTLEADEVAALPLRALTPQRLATFGDLLDALLDDMGWERTGPWHEGDAPVKPYGP